MTELNRRRVNVSQRSYRPLTSPIPPETAEAEPEQERVFAPDPPPPPAAPAAPYPARVYTVRAVSPGGFAVSLAFSDITLDRLEAHLTKLAELGYTPDRKAPA